MFFIFPPGSLGSKSGRGQIPQESRLRSGLSKATCLCSPLEVLKCFSKVWAPKLSSPHSPLRWEQCRLHPRQPGRMPLVEPTMRPTWGIRRPMVLLSNPVPPFSAPLIHRVAFLQRWPGGSRRAIFGLCATIGSSCFTQLSGHFSALPPGLC